MQDYVNQVLNTIEKLKEEYPKPQCYLVASAISSVFPATIWYDNNHCITQVEEHFFDKRGLVDAEAMNDSDYIPLNMYGWDCQLRLIQSMFEKHRDEEVDVEPAVIEKYYIPAIQEFKHGFEFQSFMDGKWQDCVLELGDEGLTVSVVEKIKREISENKIRVKYLDEQDILDLGFYNRGFNSYSDGLIHIEITTSISDNLTIHRLEPNSAEISIVGIFKNKSELKSKIDWLKTVPINKKW